MGKKETEDLDEHNHPHLRELNTSEIETSQ